MQVEIDLPAADVVEHTGVVLEATAQPIHRPGGDHVDLAADDRFGMLSSAGRSRAPWLPRCLGRQTPRSPASRGARPPPEHAQLVLDGLSLRCSTTGRTAPARFIPSLQRTRAPLPVRMFYGRSSNRRRAPASYEALSLARFTAACFDCASALCVRAKFSILNKSALNSAIQRSVSEMTRSSMPARLIRFLRSNLNS